MSLLVRRGLLALFDTLSIVSGHLEGIQICSARLGIFQGACNTSDHGLTSILTAPLKLPESGDLLRATLVLSSIHEKKVSFALPAVYKGL